MTIVSKFKVGDVIRRTQKSKSTLHPSDAYFDFLCNQNHIVDDIIYEVTRIKHQIKGAHWYINDDLWELATPKAIDLDFDDDDCL